MAVRLIEASRATTPTWSVGARLIFMTFVLTQFVEVTFDRVGSVEISLQKVATLIVFPIGFTMLPRARWAWSLPILALVMVAANSAAYLSESDFLNANGIAANVTVATGLLGGAVLYVALTQDERLFATFARVWIAFAAFSSVIVLLQSAGVLPLWFVEKGQISYRAAETGGLIRGTGFKYDPNYQAFVLVVGLVFAWFYGRRWRLPAAALIVGGVIGTFSRMGLLASVVTILLAPSIRVAVARQGVGRVFTRFVLGLTVAAIVAVGAGVIAPEGVRRYAERRSTDIVVAYERVTGGDLTELSGLNSVEERLLVAYTALGLLNRNKVVGIGGYGTADAVAEVIGITRTIHNTYLEELVVGGLFGAAAIVVYVVLLARALARARHPDEDKTRRSCLITLSLVFALMSLFLTLNYNSIAWLPLTVALAHAKLELMGHANGHSGELRPN